MGRVWKRLINQLLNDYAGDQAWAALTIDHLAGQEAYSQPEDQVHHLPRPVLNYIKDTARKALIQVPDNSQQCLDFVDINQGPSETYMKFIDRL